MAYAAKRKAKAKAVDLPSLETRIDWVDQWEEQTREARKPSVRDREYYDHAQWTRDEVSTLEERNQPVLTKNRIKRKIDFILGEEIEKRVDPVARPKSPQHEDAARAMTDALRYVEEEQEFDEVRSAVIKNMIVEGYGGAIKELEDCGDGDFKHVLRHIEWDRLGYDPHSRHPLFDDARYRFLITWYDLEDAEAEWPDMADNLRAAVDRQVASQPDETTSDTPRLWVDGKRKRVAICEMYFRCGKDYYRSDFTECGDLHGPEPTGFMDEKRQYNVCPLVMASCYVDRNGNRFGVVRGMISPQDEHNKRASKALHLLNVRNVLAEQDTIRDPNKFQEEMAKPDGFYDELAPGTLAESRIKIDRNLDLAQSQIALMQQARDDIDSIGPSASNLPELPESSSGRAFLARQKAAARELSPVFSALRLWTKRVFALDWLCIRMVWTEEKWLRVTDDQELTGYRFVALNQRMSRAQRLQELLQKQPPPELPKAVAIAAGTEAPAILAAVQYQHQQMMQQAQQQATMAQQQGVPPQAIQQQMQQLQSPEHMQQMVLAHPAMQQEITVNQVDQMLADIVIDEAPETAVIEQEEFATLSEVLPTVVQARPDMAPKIVTMLIKSSQLRNKRELVQEFEKGPDPQQVKLKEAMQQIQVKGAQAGVAVDESQAQLNTARAQSEQAKTQIDAAKAPAEIAKTQAQAMRDGAQAGAATIPEVPL